MKFLVIAQDLRVMGTSEGIVSRSFVAKLRKTYPDALIDICYVTHSTTDDKLEILPADKILRYNINQRVPLIIRFLNKFYWRLFNSSLHQKWIIYRYARIIAKIKYSQYDHIFIRAAGINHEVILATRGLPILKKAILNFHDPYPLAWYVGTKKVPDKLYLNDLYNMIEVVHEARAITTTANYMSHDLQYLYASKKYIHTLPHQYDPSVFDLNDKSQVLKKGTKINISYHGALMFGRNIENLLDAYIQLLNENDNYQNNTEFVLRLKGEGIAKLKNKYKAISNIKILDTIDFSNSANEQIYESDIVVILENGPLYSNILVGKAPFLAYYNKAVLCISPQKSELKEIIRDNRCIANMNDKTEIKYKLNELIINRLKPNEPFNPFGNYFSDEMFKIQLNKIIAC
jgi:hypothetical protein